LITVGYQFRYDHGLDVMDLHTLNPQPGF